MVELISAKHIAQVYAKRVKKEKKNTKSYFLLSPFYWFYHFNNNNKKKKEEFSHLPGFNIFILGQNTEKQKVLS